MHKRKSISAVVLGSDVNGLGHIRSLGKMGISSYAVHSSMNFESIGRFSKYCVPVYIPKEIPDYKSKLIKHLIGLADSIKNKPVLYATSDFFVNFIALNREVLKEYYLFNLPANDILGLITNKYSTDRVARNCGLRSPKTMRFLDFKSETSIDRSIKYPCIIKPQDSYSSDFPGKNKIIENEGELINFFAEFPHLKKDIIIQEIIPGAEKNIFQCTVYVGQNVPMQFFTMQKIHQYPPGYGITTLGHSTTIISLMEKTKRILEDINYQGFGSVEFKKNDENKEHYLIEINPRLPWYNALFLSSGVNFPYLAYRDLRQSSLIPPVAKKQKDNVYWVHLKNEISGFFKRKKSGDRVDVAEYIKNIIKSRSFAYFDLYDLKPFIKVSLEFLKRFLNKAFHRSNYN